MSNHVSEEAMGRVARGLVDHAGAPDPIRPAPESPLRGLVQRPASLVQAEAETAAKEAADLNTKERAQLAKEGKALPDGSFPIRNVVDLHKAIIRAHQANDEPSAKALIRKRAKALGVELPKDF